MKDDGKLNRNTMLALCGAMFVAGAITATKVAKTKDAAKESLETVPSVDLEKYAGQWYEIARYPNRFERKCVSDVVVNYTLRTDGKIEVVNQCHQKNGKIETAKGTAEVVDKSTNAKLKVKFFLFFSGDYWIIDLGKNYEYAVVGEPSRKHLWILSRTPQIDETIYTQILRRINAQGYDASKLVKTMQNQKKDSEHRTQNSE